MAAVSVKRSIGFPNTFPRYPVDSAIHLLNNRGLINHYPADKYLGNQLRYPLDRHLSIG